ncbi:plectin-like [Linepithema humile]|uniref:plectin-like n=1 Tax=Linepithema humile TaxID=83485 RepID=UPI00351F78BC
MPSILLLSCVLTTWLYVNTGAITVSIDRADIKIPPTRSSMIANGWRPLTTSYEETIGTNVSPSSHLKKNVQVHPVLSKFQEHMATSEKLKVRGSNGSFRKGEPPIREYNPPSILGSFTVFGHAATKARGETKTPGKHASETREYTFLIPPPKDAYRFELNQHRKPVLRDGVNFLRPAASVYQQPASDPVRAATYFIKGYASTTNPSTHLANNRPYVSSYAMPQALQPPRQVAAKPFESLKVNSNSNSNSNNNNNAKPFFQPPGADVPGDFGKQKIGDRDSYDGRLQPQSHNAQVLHSASSGNFYSQVNHPSGQSFKSTYERDPAFLVHESHEVSYVTPPGTYSAYSFRPSLPYENLLPPAVYAPSTPATPTAAVTRNPVNKYGQTDVAERDFKRTEQLGARGKQDKAGGQTELPNSRTTGTYYVSEQPDLTPPTWPKSKYTSDINEVLPRESPPGKFSQEAVVSQNQITQIPKIVYQRPQSSFEPVEVYRPTSVPDYETPESISLKHFNEQQFLLQQQLLQRDREQLAEQERQQKLQLERQQQEELKKRQEELNELLQREKEEEDAARLAAESAKNQSQEIVKIAGEMPYTIQLAQYEQQVTTDVNILVPADVGIYNLEQLKLQPQIPQAAEGPANQNYQYQQRYPNEYQEQQVDYREPQTETRPYRPQKPLRDPYRRKKPTTIAYDTPTEPPSQLPDTSVPLTLHGEEVPIQTTEAPETQTLPATQRPRSRRPGVPARRRKPTTTTEEPVTVSYADEDFLKYRGDEQSSQYDPSRRRRVKPAGQTGYSEDAEKRGGTRKRPNYRTRVNQGDSYDAQIVTESAPTSYGQTTEPAASYDENNQFATNQPSVSYGTSQAGEQYATNPSINQYHDYSSQQSEKQREEQREEQREDTTAPVQAEYFTEISRDKAENPRENVNIVTAIPLEELYVKTDGNYYDRATTLASTTTTTTTTTTAAPATTTQAASSTPRSHKINRPLRYGNATRPRFSIKDYKSRMDYKSRLSQGTTTELAPTPVDAPLTRTKQRASQSAKGQPVQQQQSADTVRETTGRYKYVSRVSYRTTTSASSPREHERLSEEGASDSTTEKSNRFVPKRRPISSNVYRSRIASTTTSPTRSQINSETSSTVQRQSSARPENVYSSSIRRRPVMKSRLQTQHREHSVTTYPESKRQEEPTEMAAEETSFYSTMTTAASSSSSTARLVGNEIVGGKADASSRDKQSVKFGAQNAGHEIEITSRDEDPEAAIDRDQIFSGEKSESSANGSKIDADAAEATTELDARDDEEELFAKASQSVADLTSSASALYDKPGMFKAVSPESRHVSSHFKIATDEPTLPIEAFFQELSKKNSD